MARRLKLTGFARFFFLLIILAPLSYIVASYANGEDGIENIKKLLGLETRIEAAPGEQRETAKVFVTKAQEIRYLREENADLRDSLEAIELEIHELRRQMRLLKGSKQ